MYERNLKNTDEENKMQGPGPGAYYLKSTIGMSKETDLTYWKCPAFSLRRLTNEPSIDSSPGPIYKVDGVTRHGRNVNVKVPVGIKLKSYDAVKSPGPAAYLPCYPNLKHAPTPKILFLPKDGNKFITPAPNAYTALSMKSFGGKKGYTIKWKTENRVGEIGMESLGPAAYNPVNTNVYKNRAPVGTFGMRIYTDKLVKQYTAERPHAYSVSTVECAKNCRKRVTFGVRHSKKCSPYVLPADNSMP